jgi:hypothetical protein
MKNNEIHIGNLILQKLEEEKRSLAWLVSKLYTDSSSLHKTLKKRCINTATLERINEALGYNFFRYYVDEEKE